MPQAKQTYWIIITADAPRRYTVHLVADANKSTQPPQGAGPIVHVRRFDDILVAMGYRIVLNSLSPSSLLRVIKKRN